MPDGKRIKEVYTPDRKSEKHPEVYRPTKPSKPSKPTPPQGSGIPPVTIPRPSKNKASQANDIGDLLAAAEAGHLETTGSIDLDLEVLDMEKKPKLSTQG
jgi:hypothetical protein